MQLSTYSAAADKYNKEALDGTTRANNPGHSDEQDNTEDVLKTRKKDTHDRPEIGFLGGFLVWIFRSILNG